MVPSGGRSFCRPEKMAAPEKPMKKNADLALLEFRPRLSILSYFQSSSFFPAANRTGPRLTSVDEASKPALAPVPNLHGRACRQNRSNAGLMEFRWHALERTVEGTRRCRLVVGVRFAISATPGRRGRRRG